MAEKTLQKLPLGLNSFRKIRDLNCLYVDKTEYVYNLITGGWRYFLSRPRRFGKSLLVSTLHEVLSGNKELFKDLWIEKSDYSWKPHGVISISLSIVDAQNVTSFRVGLCRELTFIAQQYGILLTIEQPDAQGMFVELIRALYGKFNRVAILVDEYDNPILRNLDDEKNAIAIRDTLRTFFAVIKDLDALIDFVFITGVSSFARAGIFSGLNNLSVITLNDEYGSILGYTNEEVDHYFGRYMQAWADKKNISYHQLRENVKTWYNGYRFGDQVPSVYNPFSLMNALNAYNFDNFWIQSGTPSFLMKEINKEYRNEQLRIFDAENIVLDKNDLSSIDIGSIPLPTLIFQTGYLTIDTYNETTKLYKLKFPNFEVKESFQKLLLNVVAQIDLIEVKSLLQSLLSTLHNGDMPEMIQVLKQLFSRISYHQNTTPEFNEISKGRQEKFYHAILQIIFDLTGVKVQSEYATSHGRIDLVLELPQSIYIIETKLNESPESALAQIEEKRYWEPFLKYGKPIILLGISFQRKPGKFDITYVSKKL